MSKGQWTRRTFFKRRHVFTLVAVMSILALVVASCADDEPDNEAGSDADDRPTVEAASSTDNDASEDENKESESENEESADDSTDESGAESSDSDTVGTLEESEDDGQSTTRVHNFTMQDTENDDRVSIITYEEQPTAGMDALLEGELTRSGECVGVTNPQTDEFTSVVWPEGYTLEIGDEGVVLLDSDGETVAEEGETVAVGGGESPDPDGYITKAVTQDCRAETYWMSSGDGQLADSTSGEASSGDSGDVETEEDARQADAEWYADEYDVSLEEAKRRMELQTLPGPLQEALMEHEADRFGGLYLEHEPEFRVVVLMTDGDEEAVRSYIDDPELDEVVEVEQVEYTYEELLATQEEVMDLMHDLDLPVSGGPNLKENRVEIFAPDVDEVEAALSDAGEELPDNVEILEGEQPQPLDG